MKLSKTQINYIKTALFFILVVVALVIIFIGRNNLDEVTNVKKIIEVEKPKEISYTNNIFDAIVRLSEDESIESISFFIDKNRFGDGETGYSIMIEFFEPHPMLRVEKFEWFGMREDEAIETVDHYFATVK